MPLLGGGGIGGSYRVTGPDRGYVSAQSRSRLVGGRDRVRITQRWVHVSMTETPDVGLKDLAGAVVRIADSLDRAVFVLEALGVHMKIVHPADIGPSPKAQEIAET